ncbi:MAG: hypothetical protein ACKVZH_06440 [Blastocatellia bacterium]
MSARNGDRARFNRESKKRRLNRIRIQELRKTLTANKAAESKVANLAEGETQVISS